MGRTMAVVLFTDLVGFTERRGRPGSRRPKNCDAPATLRARAVETKAGRIVKAWGAWS
jgi:hypothetical protein